MKRYIGMFFAMMLSNASAVNDVGVNVAGMSVSYANIDCKTVGACTETRGSAPYGSLAVSKKVKGLIVSTATTMGKVTFKNIDKDGTNTNVLALQRGNVTYKSSTTSGANSLSAKVKFKF
jgi:hypothetical protein